MREQAALFALIFLFMPIVAQAPLPPPILDDGQWEITLFANQFPLPDNSIVEIRYSLISGKEYLTAVSIRNGSASIYAPGPISMAKLTYDLPSTPANDYAWSGSWDFAEGKASLSLNPVADVYGYGMLFANENVAVSCPGGYYSVARVSATGFFFFSGVPAGKCTVFPEKWPLLGKELLLSPGDYGQANLEFPYDKLLLGVLLAIIFLFAAGWIYIKSRNKPPKAEKSKIRKVKRPLAAPPSSNSISSRQSDLLSTLDEKEKSIVQFVQQSHPAAVKASKIRNALLIPKTSLTRTLQALERKQFLELKKDGSRFYVKLHPFYSKI